MNVQNIPREDKTVKRAFIPKLDVFFFADYPNIELKLLAYYLEKVGHPSMADYFRDDADADLHRLTAAAIYNKDPSEITDHERQVGKRNNFSIVYGGGIRTLIAQGVAADKDEALEQLRGFHRAWPGIGWQTKWKEADKGTLSWWINKQIQERTTPNEPGYITTLWGRHLHPRYAHAALNALIQGCAADLMKWANIQVHEFAHREQLQSHLVNVVHDEIILDAVREELPLLAERVPDLMTYQPIEDLIPIRPEPEVSYETWADKEIMHDGADIPE